MSNQIHNFNSGNAEQQCFFSSDSRCIDQSGFVKHLMPIDRLRVIMDLSLLCIVILVVLGVGQQISSMQAR
jgi:hypothetical protein